MLLVLTPPFIVLLSAKKPDYLSKKPAGVRFMPPPTLFLFEALKNHIIIAQLSEQMSNVEIESLKCCVH